MYSNMCYWIVGEQQSTTSLSLSDTWYAISSVLSIGQSDCNEQELCYYDS